MRRQGEQAWQLARRAAGGSIQYMLHLASLAPMLHAGICVGHGWRRPAQTIKPSETCGLLTVAPTLSVMLAFCRRRLCRA